MAALGELAIALNLLLPAHIACLLALSVVNLEYLWNSYSSYSSAFWVVLVVSIQSIQSIAKVITRGHRRGHRGAIWIVGAEYLRWLLGEGGHVIAQSIKVISRIHGEKS